MPFLLLDVPEWPEELEDGEQCPESVEGKRQALAVVLITDQDGAPKVRWMKAHHHAAEPTIGAMRRWLVKVKQKRRRQREAGEDSATED